jgi:uncharacterized protein YqeY
MLKVQISKDYMTAFKENVMSKLTIRYKGEIQTIEKHQVENLSDEEVIKILNKTAKSLK